MSSRRGFLHTLTALPVVGPVVGWFAPSLVSAKAEAAPMARDVYKELGLRSIVNAAGTYTILGGSLIHPEVVAAMAAAARQFINLGELHAAVGKQIAEMLGSEAALVTAGAASALTLATAACVAGKDADKIRRLPDTTGMKNEVIIQKAHRFGYDHAVRNVGVKLIEVETAAELEKAVNARTAMMLFYNDFDAMGKIKVEEFVKLGKKLGVVTLNDAAADVPPIENFARYLKMGYDFVVFSGGKGLRGPQSAGLLLGRKELIEAAALNNNPNADSVGRTNKVGKEEIVGMWAALRRFLKQDHAAVWAEWEKRVQTIADLVTTVKGVKTEKFVPPIANHTPHLRLTWDAGLGVTPAEVAKRLREGTPRIEVRPIIAEALEVSVWMLEPGEERIVGERLRDALKKA